MVRPTIELVQAVQGGDNRAVQELMTRYLPRILRMVRHRVGPKLREKLQSMDLVQEVFMRILRDMKGFTPRSDASFANWVSTLVANTIVDQADFFNAQKRKAAREIPISDGWTSSEGGLQIEDASIPRPDTAHAIKEEQQVLEQCLDKLKPKERDLILMRDLSEMTFEEVGSEMDMTPDAVRMAYGRAKNNLAKVVQLVGRKPLS